MLLGVIIDSNLSWKAQIQKVRHSVLLKLSILRTMRKYLPTGMRILYYNYYIKPHLLYCCSIWGQCSQKDMATVIKLQKQTARLALDADPQAPSAPLLSKLKWQTFNQILHQRQATLVFKALNNLAPRYMNELFLLPSANTTHSLRSSTFNKLCIPLAHPKSLRVCGPKIWNSLSPEARRANTIEKFRTEYLKCCKP